ncbi:MAG: hypothetical protein EBR10_03760 [Planctomycetes bacterium]|nr:hypothetical protein [Planctomycetota bacterium]
MRRALLRKIRCPHCWHQFPAEDICWVSSHPDLRNDPVLAADAQLRFVPSRYTAAGEGIDAMGSTCRRLACPRCHLQIPSVMLEHRARILSIVGTPSSGKTFFLTAAAWMLRQRLEECFALTLADADPQSNQALTRNEQLLFLPDNPDGLVALDKTQLEGDQYSTVQIEPGQTTTLPEPYLFSVRPTAAHVFAAEAQERTEVLCLYDNAGEHFLPGGDLATSPTTQHLARAKMLYFLFDPTQDVRFRRLLEGLSSDPQLTQASRPFRQDTVVQEMAARIRRMTSLSSSDRLQQPLVVVVTKSDVWRSLVPGMDIESDPYVLDSRPGGLKLGGLDMERISRVSDEVEALLRKSVPEFVSAVRGLVSEVMFVPVSATGCSPVLSNGLLRVRASKVNPWWVTVPFLLDLARLGTIVGVRRASGAPTG